MGIPTHGWQYEILMCPFCQKDTISGRYFPSAVSFKRGSTASLPGKGSFHKSKESWIIESGCSNCGKSKDDVIEEMQKKDMI